MCTRRRTKFVAQRVIKPSKRIVCWLLLLNKKSNVVLGTLKLVQLHKRSIDIILCEQKVYLLETLFYDELKNLPEMDE